MEFWIRRSLFVLALIAQVSAVHVPSTSHRLTSPATTTVLPLYVLAERPGSITFIPSTSPAANKVTTSSITPALSTALLEQDRSHDQHCLTGQHLEARRARIKRLEDSTEPVTYLSGTARSSATVGTASVISTLTVIPTGFITSALTGRTSPTSSNPTPTSSEAAVSTANGQGRILMGRGDKGELILGAAGVLAGLIALMA